MKWPLTGEPYLVQTKAMEAAEDRPGFAYFLEMGLGKTAIILAEYMNLREQGKVNHLIVVCPNSLKKNWIDEAKHWGIKDVRLFAWPKLPDRGGDFIITINYEAFSSGYKKGSKFLDAVLTEEKTLLVLDESTQVKNHQSKRTKELMLLARKADYVRILSGHPVVQGPHDLWSQLKIIGGIPKMNFYAFRNRYCRMGGWMSKQIIGVLNEEELSELMRSMSFRAMKKDWTDLPPKLPPVTHDVQISKIEKEHYDKMKKDFITMVNGEIVEAGQVITQLLKLQQISSGFIIDENGVPHQLVEKPTKMRVLEEILEGISGKILIFAHFRYTISLLFNTLQEQYNPAIMVGKSDYKVYNTDLDAEKAKFESDSTCRVFIIQTSTGKYGHTLLGGPKNDRCSTTIFYENSYSLDERVQAEDRNHRHGQDHPVAYIDLICSEVEQSAISALQRKENVADKIINRFREAKSNGHLQESSKEVS